MSFIFYSDRFVPQLPEGHRFPIQKYQLIREQLLYEGSLSTHHLREAEPCEEVHILQVHSRKYWDALKNLALPPREQRRLGFPQSQELIERSRRSVQGTVLAARTALREGIGMNIAGGTHHAYPDHGEGFCLLNDIAIAITVLLNEEKVQRVLIVDLDVHQGNGNAFIFKADPRVFTFSMHGADNYPLKKEKSDLDVGLSSFVKDKAYLQTLEQYFPLLIQTHQPDIIFYQAGVDVLDTDLLGKLSLTKWGCKERDRFVLENCYQAGIPVAVSIGGGYSKRLADTVDAHANTFRIATALYKS